MNSKSFIRLFAIAGATSLLLTACSVGGDKSETQRVTIDSILGAPDRNTIDYGGLSEQHQESIAKCMKAAGFEYIPIDVPGGDPNVEYTDEDEVERIKREGMGVANSIFSGRPAEMTSNFVDPNVEYVESLSAAELEAYDAAMNGTPEELLTITTYEIDPDTGSEITLRSHNSFGCAGKTYDETYGNILIFSPGYEDAVDPYLKDIQERFEADPRIVKLTEKWPVCMKKAGYDFASHEELWAKGTWAFEDRVIDVIDRDYFQHYTITADQRTQLEVIFAEEVKVALADHTCSKDLKEKSPEIYAEIEETYALEHQDELEALAASLLSGK